jgi:glycosyltransferase involved in cell wall biosynthesis
MFLSPSLYAVGGMQAWLAALMPELRRRDWDVWLALPTGPHNDAAAYLEQYPFDQVELVSNPTGTRWGRLRGLQRSVAHVRPDVVVAANLVSVFPAIADLRARCLPSPRLVAAVHSLDSGIFADLEHYAYLLDGVAAPNRLVVAAAEGFRGLAPERVFYAPYRVDVPLFQESLPEGEILHLVFAHRLEQEQKRALDLPKLCQELDRRRIAFKLDVVGSGTSETGLQKALAKDVELGRVRFLGPIPPADLRAKALSPGRVLLILSTWELGPMVGWQAMAWGVPVVSSRYVGSGREAVLREGENAMLFPIGDMSAAAESIHRLAASGDRAALARRAWETVDLRFSSRTSGAAWDAGLRSALESPLLATVSKRPAVPVAGRLDRALGVRHAERLRRWMRWPVKTSGPGDEWPHTERQGIGKSEFFKSLAALDGVALAEDGSL